MVKSPKTKAYYCKTISLFYFCVDRDTFHEACALSESVKILDLYCTSVLLVQAYDAILEQLIPGNHFAAFYEKSYKHKFFS